LSSTSTSSRPVHAGLGQKKVCRGNAYVPQLVQREPSSAGSSSTVNQPSTAGTRVVVAMAGHVSPDTPSALVLGYLATRRDVTKYPKRSGSVVAAEEGAGVGGEAPGEVEGVAAVAGVAEVGELVEGPLGERDGRLDHPVGEGELGQLEGGRGLGRPA